MAWFSSAMMRGSFTQGSTGTACGGGQQSQGRKRDQPQHHPSREQVAFAPGVDDLVGHYQQGRYHGREQKRGSATGAIKVGGYALEGGSGVFCADNAGVFGGVLNVCKAGHFGFPFLTLVARLPGDGVILGFTLYMFKFIF